MQGIHISCRNSLRMWGVHISYQVIGFYPLDRETHLLYTVGSNPPCPVSLFLSPFKITPIPSPPFHWCRFPYCNLPRQTSSPPVHLQSPPRPRLIPLSPPNHGFCNTESIKISADYRSRTCNPLFLEFPAPTRASLSFLSSASDPAPSSL
jgi:hypothetical protein